MPTPFYIDLGTLVLFSRAT